MASIVSCAAPARLRRIVDLGERGLRARTGGDLAELLEKALDGENPEAAHALGHFVERWKRDRNAAASGLVESGSGQGYQVSFEAGGHGAYPLHYFDQISPAADYRVRKIEHHRRDGVGAPLVAVRENRGAEPLEIFYPPEAISRSLTAVIEARGTQAGVRQVEIRLLCPLQNDEVEVDGSTQALAADFSVPWASVLSRAGELNRTQLTEAFRREPRQDPRLYLMEAYDPNKEPLIMIHGLMDTPLIWAKLSNQLWADDQIRRRYQIWHFLYNTAAPALYSGRILREQLRELRPMLDPTGRDRAMQSSTVIAHSMGGIVTRSLVTEPGDAFWDAAFTKPIESLSLTETDRASLTEAFIWQPERHVKRAIYIAVPHRGSDSADSFLGRIGRRLVKPPNDFAAFYERISTANPGAFTPAYAELGSGKLDSVHSLSPKQPTLKILAGLPHSHPVSAHSIIGDRGKGVPLVDSSDGIVPYWSSHLPKADSEKIVASDHDAFDHPDAIAEIKRILKL